MKNEIADGMSNIRDAWTEEERRERKQRAGTMQLELRALLVLSDLSRLQSESEDRALLVANAC